MRKILYMATVTAIRHNPAIRDFHTRLCAKGKPKKVALVAAMRKLPTVLNAVSQGPGALANGIFVKYGRFRLLLILGQPRCSSASHRIQVQE